MDAWKHARELSEAACQRMEAVGYARTSADDSEEKRKYWLAWSEATDRQSVAHDALLRHTGFS